MGTFEILKNIGAVAGAVISCMTLIGLCTSKGREVIRNIINKNTKELSQMNQQQNESIQAIMDKLDTLCVELEGVKEYIIDSCRQNIKHIYFLYNKKEIIPLYQLKAAKKTYDIYKDTFNGNSYIDTLMEEIDKWKIDKSNEINVLDDIG